MSIYCVQGIMLGPGDSLVNRLISFLPSQNVRPSGNINIKKGKYKSFEIPYIILDLIKFDDIGKEAFITIKIITANLCEIRHMIRYDIQL